MPTTPFVPFVKTAQLNCRYSCLSEPVENVYHFVGSSAWTSTLLAGLANDFKDIENAYLKAWRHTSTALLEVYAIDLTARDGQWDVSGYHVDGTHTGNPLPNNCSIAIKSITAKRGRSYRGRSFWIGLSESMLASTGDNYVDPAAITGIQTAMRHMLTTTWTNAAVPVVASRRNDNAWRSTGETNTILDYQFTDEVIDSQRRRLPGHNVHR